MNKDSGAILSEDNKYRYFLYRKVSNATGKVLFIGVNPSTADHEVDDATVRKWRGFMERKFKDCGIFGVCNLFSYRSTDVSVLKDIEDPIGEFTDRYIKRYAGSADHVVPCWGIRIKYLKDCGIG